MSDRIYKIVPIEGGFEAVWGFNPNVPQKPTHNWVTDELAPYSEADKQELADFINGGPV